jgi:hypothetical protein
MSACAWCHRYVGGEADRCQFPGSQQHDYERRLEELAHAINRQLLDSRNPAGECKRGDR